MKKRYCILAVDDEPNMRASLTAILQDQYAVEVASSGVEALEVIKKKDINLVITDAKMPEMDGYQLQMRLKKKWPDLPVIMITAYATPELAVKAIKSGAYDYIAKPFDPDEILFTISRALEHSDIQKENEQLRQALQKNQGIEAIIGKNAVLQKIKSTIETVAPTNANVLIEGESGTGKELVAQAIHSLSLQKEGPFIAVNCAALPEQLLESELFGHEKGAFTGAFETKKGKFEIADKGTIYLDEIGDMSLSLQAKILRVIEEREFQRVGGNAIITTDVRIIAATNKNLKDAINEETFREDLYYRLNVINIMLPPLRERKDDIPLLANFFLNNYKAVLDKSVSGLTKNGMNKLVSHSWPGNIRELRNTIERAVIMSNDKLLSEENIDIVSMTDSHKSDSDSQFQEILNGRKDFKQAIEYYETQILSWALNETNHKMQEAADLLGISRHSLRHHMKRLRIQ